MASKIHSGGLLGGQPGKKTFLKASRTPQGSLLGDYLGIQNRCKPVPEAFPKRKCLRTAFWNGFGTPQRPILKPFLKAQRDNMRSKSDKSDEMQIFEKT